MHCVVFPAFVDDVVVLSIDDGATTWGAPETKSSISEEVNPWLCRIDAR